MKKNFKFYALGWFVLLGLFNLLAFIIPAWPTLEKYTASFWIGWGCTIAAFVGQLICSWFAFKDDSAKKTFYNVSLFKVSLSGLITLFVVSLIFMVITPLPYWIAAIVCAIILASNVIAVAKAQVAINVVKDVDAKVENSTANIIMMRVDGESILARAKNDEIKAVCTKVRDELKFSDPVSNPALAGIESDINTHLSLLKAAVVADDVDAAKAEAEEVLLLLGERNNKCKALK